MSLSHLFLLGSLVVAGIVMTVPVLAATYTVSTEPELQAALTAANGGGGNSTLFLADGTYTLSDTLYVNAPNIMIRSQSGNRANVIVQGDAMSAGANIGNVIRVAASGVTVRDLTLRRSRWHLIQVVGEANADNFLADNLIFRDAYEQMVKITYDPGNLAVSADNGTVSNSLFEYTAGIGPQYYIGGVDGHNATDWVIRGNTFRDIASPNTAVAEHAVHFWSESDGTIVEGNTIIDCDRGIGFGLEAGRGHIGGVIRNNMITHSNNSDPFADAGVALAYSPGTVVYNNSVYLANSFPWAIEYRFPETSGVVIRNNLTNRAIQARDGATGTVSNNVTSAESSWFAGVANGNLHLVSNASTLANAIDRGVTIATVLSDFDGEARPIGVAYDIGADEYATGDTTPPAAPTGLGAS